MNGSLVRSSFEFCSDFYVNVRAVEIIHNVVDLISLHENGIATPFAEFLRYHRVCVLFQSGNKLAVILVEQ